MVKISEIFSTSSQTILLQDPTVICVQKFGTRTRNGNFGENIVKELKGLVLKARLGT